MDVYHRFPYANFHEINIDWLLRITKHLEDWCAQFDPDMIKNDIQDIINQMVEDGEFDQFFAEWITPLQTAIDDLTPRVESLETSQGVQDENIQTLANSLSSLSGTVSSNYTELSGAITTINNITIPSVQSDIVAVSSNLTTLSDDYSAFKSATNSELADHETRITALENDEPPVPSYLNRNMTYRGQKYNTLSELLTAIESGVTYIGDYWTGIIPHPDPSFTNYAVTVYVAYHKSNSSAYLVIVPNDTIDRNAVDYADSLSVMLDINNIAQRNYNTFNNKLSTFNIYDPSATVVKTVWGCLLSCTQFFGYPAFNSTTELKLTNNGKLPFVEHYINTASDIMLLDNNVDYYSFANKQVQTIGGLLSYSNNVSTPMAYPFIVKYN